MPRFYFDIDDGRLEPDTEGTELGSTELALEMAHQFARELALDELRAGRSFAHQAVVIRSEAGEMARVPLHVQPDDFAGFQAPQSLSASSPHP